MIQINTRNYAAPSSRHEHAHARFKWFTESVRAAEVRSGSSTASAEIVGWLMSASARKRPTGACPEALRLATVPSFTFIDPFGYVGLTRDLIKGVTKNWGSDCIFFFNYDRINRALSTSIFTPRMEAIFGKERAVALEAHMQKIKGSHGSNPQKREEIIVDTLTEALEELSTGETYVRTFRFKKGKRTSHMLVFVTHHPLGYRVMNENMAKQGFIDGAGMPSYTYYDDPPSKNQLFYPEFDKLKEKLLKKYAGKTRTLKEIYEKHSVRRDYILSNYRDALGELENESLVTCDPLPRIAECVWESAPSPRTRK